MFPSNASTGANKSVYRRIFSNKVIASESQLKCLCFLRVKKRETEIWKKNRAGNRLGFYDCKCREIDKGRNGPEKSGPGQDFWARAKPLKSEFVSILRIRNPCFLIETGWEQRFPGEVENPDISVLEVNIAC